MTSSEQIFNTLVLPYLNHAVRTYESGYASVADIDAAMRFGCGYPKGPLTVVDEIGAAQVRVLLAARYAETGDHLHQPADLLGRYLGGRVAQQGRQVPGAVQQGDQGLDVIAEKSGRAPLKIERIGRVGAKPEKMMKVG